MSNLAKKQNHGYVVVDFDKVNKQGLKKLTNALKKAGSPVTDIEATNKPMRRDTVQVKRAKFFFENGQTMTIFVGSEGDVYQLLLNSTKQPLPNASSDRDLAIHMTKLMERNQKKFDKAKARQAKKAIKAVDNDKPLTQGLKARAAAATAALTSAQESHQQLITQRDSVKQSVQEKTSLVAELTDTLKAEKAETAELEQQLKELD